MFRRPFLVVLLSLGVVFGYGSAFASMRHRMHGCHDGGGHWGHWEQSQRFEGPPPAPLTVAAPPAPAPVSAPVIVAPAPAAAPAPIVMPQVFVVMPGAATPASTVVTAPPVVQQVPAASVPSAVPTH